MVCSRSEKLISVRFAAHQHREIGTPAHTLAHTSCNNNNHNRGKILFNNFSSGHWFHFVWTDLFLTLLFYIYTKQKQQAHRKNKNNSYILNKKKKKMQKTRGWKRGTSKIAPTLSSSTKRARSAVCRQYAIYLKADRTYICMYFCVRCLLLIKVQQ